MSKYENINKKIAELKRTYKNDSDARLEIDRAEESILYYERKGDEKKAASELKQLEAFLHDWY